MLREKEIQQGSAQLAEHAGMVREELARVLASRAFAASERLRNLLSYVTEFALAHPGTTLKEVQIGIELYRIADYDPKSSATVRVDVSRLRQKLLAYYSSEGTGNPARLELPQGTYLPAVRFVAVEPPPAPVQPGNNKLRVTAATVFAVAISMAAAWYFRTGHHSPSALALVPVMNRSGDPAIDTIAQSLTRMLAQELPKQSGAVIIPLIEVEDRALRGQTPDTMVRRLRGSVLLETSLTGHGGNYRVSVRALDLDRGVQLWSGTAEGTENALGERVLGVIRRNLSDRSADSLTGSTVAEANQRYSEARSPHSGRRRFAGSCGAPAA